MTHGHLAVATVAPAAAAGTVVFPIHVAAAVALDAALLASDSDAAPVAVVSGAAMGGVLAASCPVLRRRR